MSAELEERQEEETGPLDTRDKTPTDEEKRAQKESKRYEEFLNDETYWK